ncbi:hypothetical protein OKJ48_11310 [Streptomyces kunmingensis]|uniref:Abortive infection protein n=1 Tax=Streptomyces kunmingensis TaxID=68225 RepID=A0ABU6C9U0_9ACTN|nr:hypothetical protein [Streptomyces kunmingensis]MEB3960826.1 hypothetical protein [Streptomyces kunmingensis]
MRARGINYDTGFLPGEQFTRRTFHPASVRHEMRVIADELHCDTVRISGRDPERLSLAARYAAEAGLEVWFAPFPVDLPAGRLLPFFADCARRAEAVRRTGARVVFVTGCEISVFCGGFFPGDTFGHRVHTMGSDPQWWSSLGRVSERVNSLLAEAVTTVRTHFGGQVTYASGPWETIDWTPFDLVGIDAYRPAHTTDTFRTHLREFFRHGKPVVVTEFGTCAYRGATDLGGMAWNPPPEAVPDEDEQVRCLSQLLTVFEEEGVDTALWFSFANYDKPGERDIASYGVVRMLDETRWEPKKVFHAMAARYARP